MLSYPSFCEPEESDPLKEIPYFIDDIRRKVFFSDDQKEVETEKQKKRLIIKVFEDEMKKEPKTLYKSKNYKDTFIYVCSESERHLFVNFFDS